MLNFFYKIKIVDQNINWEIIEYFNNHNKKYI